MSSETTPETETPTADTAAAEGGPAAQAEQEALARLQTDLDRFRDLALRSQADLDNYRKRAAREKEEAIRYANASLAGQLLPVLDNFELGLAAARSNPGDAAAILDGMGMVLRQLQDALREFGVEPVEAEGAPFDPNLHEAIGQEASPTVPEGTVARQLRRGYRLRERLLRPANVIVSSGPAPAGA